MLKLKDVHNINVEILKDDADDAVIEYYKNVFDNIVTGNINDWAAEFWYNADVNNLLDCVNYFNKNSKNFIDSKIEEYTDLMFSFINVDVDNITVNNKNGHPYRVNVGEIIDLLDYDNVVKIVKDQINYLNGTDYFGIKNDFLDVVFSIKI